MKKKKKKQAVQTSLYWDPCEVRVGVYTLTKMLVYECIKYEFNINPMIEKSFGWAFFKNTSISQLASSDHVHFELALH